MIKVVNEIFNLLVNSFTSNPSDLEVIEFDAGDVIQYPNGSIRLKTLRHGFAIVDGVHETEDENVVDVSIIRQVLYTQEESVTQNFCDPKDSVKLRTTLLERNAETVTVPGGVPPLTEKDMVAVPAFKAMGTTYFLVPKKVIEDYQIPIYERFVNGGPCPWAKDYIES